MDRLLEPRLQHRLGAGLNWGEPNETSFDPGLDDQWTVEAYYRLQVKPELAITAVFELIQDPALNRENDTVWGMGIRARLAL